MLYIIFILMSVPMLMLAFFQSNENRLVWIFTIFGMLAAVISYEVNSFLNKCLNLKSYYLTVFVTPLVEELLKLFFILIFVVLATCLTMFNNRLCFSVATAVGVGFALTENTYFLTINYNAIDISWLVMRIFATGTMHIVVAAILGYSVIIFKKWGKKLYIGFLLSLLITYLYHGMYNALLLSEYKVLALLLPIVSYIIMIVYNKKSNILNAEI